MSRIWGGALAITGLIVCPCHLPLTLPLLLAVLGGTGVGSFVGAHTGLMYGIATGYFIVAVGAAWYIWNRKRRAKGAACDVPAQRKAGRNGCREQLDGWRRADIPQ